MRGYGVSNGSLPGCWGKIKIKILAIAIPEIKYSSIIVE